MNLCVIEIRNALLKIRFTLMNIRRERKFFASWLAMTFVATGQRRHKSSQVLNFRSASAVLNCSFYGDWQEKAGKTCIDLCFVFKRLASSRKLKKNLRCNLNMLKLVASHRKLAFKRGTSKHKQKLAMTCVLIWSGLNKAKTADEYDDMFMSGYISIVCLNRRLNRRLNVERTSQWYMIMALRILQYSQKPK